MERSETEFSAAAISTRNLTGKLLFIMAAARPSVCAAPPISFFIISMALDGFRSRPPVSKVMPLPMSVIRGPSVPHFISIRRGGTSAARPTICKAGQVSSNTSPTVTEISASQALAKLCAALSRPAGVMILAGRLMRSRQKVVPANKDSVSIAPSGSG